MALFFLKIHQERSPADQLNESQGPNKHLPLRVDLMGKQSLMCSVSEIDFLCGGDRQSKEKAMREPAI